MFTILDTSCSKLQMSVWETLLIQTSSCKQNELCTLLPLNPTDYIVTKSDLVFEKNKQKRTLSIVLDKRLFSFSAFCFFFLRRQFPWFVYAVFMLLFASVVFSDETWLTKKVLFLRTYDVCSTWNYSYTHKHIYIYAHTHIYIYGVFP